jgi:hypothetical protein
MKNLPKPGWKTSIGCIVRMMKTPDAKASRFQYFSLDNVKLVPQDNVKIILFDFFGIFCGENVQKSFPCRSQRDGVNVLCLADNFTGIDRGRWLE